MPLAARILCCYLASAVWAQPDPAAPWPVLGGDSRRTGRSAFAGPSLVGVGVRFTIAGLGPASLALGRDGAAFFLSSTPSPSLCAYNVSGVVPTQIWCASGLGSLGGVPAVAANGLVIVGSQNGSLYALSASMGTQVWQAMTFGSDVTSSALGLDGAVITGSRRGLIFALNGSSGALAWQNSLGNTSFPIYSSPTLAEAQGVAIIGVADSLVYGLDIATGIARWVFSAPGPISPPSVGDDGSAYFGVAQGDSRVFSLDAVSGSLRWTIAVCGPVAAAPALSSASVALAYAGSSCGTLYALSVATGASVWTFSTPQGVNGGAAVGADGVVYFSSDKVYALDGATGALQYASTVGSSPAMPLIGSDGALYVVTSSEILALQGCTPDVACGAAGDVSCAAGYSLNAFATACVRSQTPTASSSQSMTSSIINSLSQSSSLSSSRSSSLTRSQAQSASQTATQSESGSSRQTPSPSPSLSGSRSTGQTLSATPTRSQTQTQTPSQPQTPSAISATQARTLTPSPSPSSSSLGTALVDGTNASQALDPPSAIAALPSSSYSYAISVRFFESDTSCGPGVYSLTELVVLAATGGGGAGQIDALVQVRDREGSPAAWRTHRCSLRL